MKDRADVQRAKARAMMGGELASAAAQRKTMGTEMGARPAPVVGRVAKGPADRYVRPGAPIQTERPPVMLAKGGSVSKAAKKAERKGEERMVERRMARPLAKMMARKDARQDKTAVARGVHAHERHLHKGEPLTKLAKGGKVKCMAAGGAAKLRRGEAKPVPKMPRGGNPQY